MVWEIWQRSQTFRSKPSELIGLDSPVKAFFFDRALWIFCRKVENEMQEAEGREKNPKLAKAARTRVFNNYIHGGVQPGQFKDPAAAKSEATPEEPLEFNLGDDFFA